MKLEIRPTARRDITDARDWYREQPAEGLDLRFVQELDRVFESLVEHPVGFPVVYRDFRRANLKRFPYSVFFQVKAGLVRVLAVVHQARHPREWQRR